MDDNEAQFEELTKNINVENKSDAKVILIKTNKLKVTRI